MWYARPRSADDDGSRAADQPVSLDVHNSDVCGYVERIVSTLGLAETSEGRALIFAAAAHDLGKVRLPASWLSGEAAFGARGCQDRRE